jgi:hypothetical protein
MEFIGEKDRQIWKELYSTLTTAQIEKALRNAKLSHEDWILFLKIFHK